ncbi:MAG: Gfo/Idh/MocA family oxidoreductase [Phycisphaerales bacterium]|nr:Gfo/Idh/MocA family oxidoreductase [Phycisphaerales bacterium]
MTPQPLRVGLVGCGNISDIYITNAPKVGGYIVAACADLDLDRARSKAAQHGIPKAGPLGEILADPEIDLILNLTPPGAHAEIGLAAVGAGKHLYNEKPLAIEIADARKLLDLAERRGVLVGCAPDTILGAGYATCRRLLGGGAIGSPVGAVGFMMCKGPELWHPDPAFFYRRGAGPLFDMGPYYLSALVSLFGPIRRVSALNRVTLAEREILSEPRRGQRVRVETPTHVSATLEFDAGPVATLVMSFDVWTHSMPPIELFGSEGTITAPDPNGFGGPVKLRRRDAPGAEEQPLDPGHAENARGLGVRELAGAIARGDRRSASGELALHVLETMHAVVESGDTGKAVTVRSTVGAWNRSAAEPAPV